MKKIEYILSGIVLTGLLAGCSNELAIPETFSVKTNAEYNFTIGNIEKSLSDVFDESSILGNSSDYKVYSYNPGGNAAEKKFLIDVPIQNIPLDFTDLIESADFSSNLENMDFSKTVTVPEVNISYDKYIPMDDVKTAICALFRPYSGTSVGSSCTISSSGFDTMSFSSGYMTINFTDGSKTGKVTLLTSGNEEISSAYIYNNVAKIPLEGKTIYPEMNLVFTDSTLAKWNSNINSAVLTQATNVSCESSIAITMPSQSFSVGGSGFSYAAVGEGSINAVAALGTGWTGVTLNYILNVTGGLSKSEGITLTQSATTADLKDAIIDPSQNIKLSFSNCSVKLTNANLDFSKLATINAAGSVQKFSAITAEISDFTDSVSISKELPDDIVKIIKSIDIKPSGFDVKYTNTFPAGNDIKIITNSSFFGISNVSTSLSANTAEDAGNASIKGSQKTLTLSTDRTVDFTAKIQLPGYTSTNPNKMTAINVMPGQTYSVGMSVTPVIDWTSVVLNGCSAQQSDTISTDLDITEVISSFESKIGTSVKDKIAVDNLPVYMYCDVPSVLSGANFNGVIYAYLGDSGKNEIGTVEKKYLLGELEGGSPVPAALTPSSVPELVQNNGEVITDISLADSSMHTDLADIMNGTLTNSNSSLCVNYVITFGIGSDITVTKADLEALGEGNKTIKMRMYVVLSVKFNVTTAFNIDLMKLIEKDDADLFNRESAPDLGDKQKYLDAVKSATVIYSSTILPFTSSGGEMAITLDLDGDGNEFESETLLLSGGSFSVNPSKLLNVYPLKPAVYIGVPVGQLSANHDLSINTNLKVKIQTDGTVKLMGGD